MQYALNIKADEFLIDKPAVYTQLARFDDVARLSNYDPKTMASEARKMLLSLPDWKLSATEKVFGPDKNKQQVINWYNDVVKYFSAIEIGEEPPEGYALPLLLTIRHSPPRCQRHHIQEAEGRSSPDLWGCGDSHGHSA